MIRIGVDVGGTFTDLVRIDDESGEITAIKVPSTSGREHEGFVDGIRQMVNGGAAADQIVHGTTVATNSLLQRKGGKVAMLCTAGFRDVLEIGRCMRYAANSLFDTKFVKPAPLVDRPDRIEIDERMAANGKALRPLSKAALTRAIKDLKARDPGSIAICLINAYANPEHERKLIDELTAAFPGVHICASTEVYQGYQEFERFATTALNAFLIPPMSSYLSVLEQSLKRAEVAAPILIMSSSGGTLTPRGASRLPVRTILSGPVGGVTASIELARLSGIENLITYDMGGTSTDVAVVRRGEAVAVNQVVLGGLPIRGSMLEINTVGAGAGSLAYRDIDGSLCIGPESAGAVPGPVCYGTGGVQPTVTDANLHLGRLNAGRKLGGRIAVRPELVEQALTRLSKETGNLTADTLADGIVRLAVAKMAGAIREISVSRGLDARRFTLVAYGGAGPMHAAFVADELLIIDVLVPQLPGNFSALGLLTADLRWEHSETLFSTLDNAGAMALHASFAKQTGMVREQVAADGLSPDTLTYEYWAEMHYVGQASGFSVKIPSADANLATLRQIFLKQYEERYGHASDTRTIAIDGARIVAIARGRRPDYRKLDRTKQAPAQGAERRKVFFGGKFWDCPVLYRDRLTPGFTTEGPAIVEEGGATTVVPPAWHVTVDPLRNLRLHRQRT